MDYAFSRRDRLLTGTTTLADTLDQRTETHQVSLALTSGITDHLTLALSLPLVVNRSVNRSLDDTRTAFSDLSAQLGVGVSPRLFGRPANLRLAAGVTLPVAQGVPNVITNERNFASGTVDPTLSIRGVMGLTPGLTLDWQLYTRQIVSTASDGSRTGDFYAYSLGLTYSPVGSDYAVSGGVDAINRNGDLFDGRPFPNSGGDWIYIKASFTQSLWNVREAPVRGWVEAQVPVYTYVEGIQLTERWNIRIGLSLAIQLVGHSHSEESVKGVPLPAFQ